MEKALVIGYSFILIGFEIAVLIFFYCKMKLYKMKSIKIKNSDAVDFTIRLAVILMLLNIIISVLLLSIIISLL